MPRTKRSKEFAAQVTAAGIAVAPKYKPFVVGYGYSGVPRSTVYVEGKAYEMTCTNEQLVEMQAWFLTCVKQGSLDVAAPPYPISNGGLTYVWTDDAWILEKGKQQGAGR